MYRIVLASLIGLLLSSELAAADLQYQGVALQFSPTVSTGLLEESLLNLQQLGSNTVAIDLLWSQATPSSDRLTTHDGTAVSQQLATIAPYIEMIQAMGMEVLLRPKLQVQSGSGSAFVQPANVGGWFRNYGDMVEEVARFAQREGVQMMSIGHALNALEDDAYAEHWRQLVSQLRPLYHGQLTYAADYTFHPAVGGGFEDVPWWNALDVIGINARFPLTADFNADQQTLLSGARGWARHIDRWLRESRLDKPVVFTEVGFPSDDGAAVFPRGSDFPSDKIDLGEQELAYQAILTAFQGRDWWQGGFWTGWQSDPLAGGPGDRGFTPQGKAAEQVLAEHFGGRANFVLLPSLLASWNQSFDGWVDPGSPFPSPGDLQLAEEIGVTEGSSSLLVASPGAVQFLASRLWTLAGSNQFALLQLASENPQAFVLELDVSVDQLPDGQTFILISLDDSEGTSDVAVPVHFGPQARTQTISLSFAELGPFDPDSLWYELELGNSNSWEGEMFFDNLRLRSLVQGDVTNDLLVSCSDIDALHFAIRQGLQDQQFDVNGDGQVSLADRSAWLSVTQHRGGDSDLNGEIEFIDFLTLSDHFGGPGNWCEGDFTGDRRVDFADFLQLSLQFGRPVPTAIALPETVGWRFWMCVLGLPWVHRYCRAQGPQRP